VLEYSQNTLTKGGTMSGISMVVSPDNQDSVAERIVAEFKGKKVNFLVNSFVLGAENPVVTKFCSRMVEESSFTKGPQISILFLPKYKIFWDLKNERVVVNFETNGDIVVCRVFSKAQRSKIVRITVNPI
jgi:hypothetical protein